MNARTTLHAGDNTPAAQAPQAAQVGAAEVIAELGEWIPHLDELLAEAESAPMRRGDVAARIGLFVLKRAELLAAARDADDAPREECDACAGSGVRYPSGPECRECGGEGVL